MTITLKISNLSSNQLSEEELAQIKGGDFVETAIDFGRKALDFGNKVTTKLPIKPTIGGSTASQLLRHAIFPPAANAPTVTDYQNGTRR